MEQIRGRLDTVKGYVLLSDESALPASHIDFCGEYEELLAAAFRQRYLQPQPLHLLHYIIPNPGGRLRLHKPLSVVERRDQNIVERRSTGA